MVGRLVERYMFGHRSFIFKKGAHARRGSACRSAHNAGEGEAAPQADGVLLADALGLHA
jgi:hypothetical protein